MPGARWLSASAACVLLLSSVPGVARDVADPRRPVSVVAGVGPGDFTSDLGAETSTGLAWGVRVGWTPFPVFGGELAFLSVNGSLTSQVSGPGTPDERQTVGLQHVTAAARAHWPVELGPSSSLEPYAHAGVGYGWVSSKDPSSAMGFPTEQTVAVPLGAGLSWNITEALTLDGRFTWSLLPNVDVPLIGDAGAWSAVVSLGARMGP